MRITSISMIGSTHIHSITAFLGNMSDCTQRPRRKHDFMIVDQRVLIDTAKDVTARYVVPDLEIEMNIRQVG